MIRFAKYSVLGFALWLLGGCSAVQVAPDYPKVCALAVGEVQAQGKLPSEVDPKLAAAVCAEALKRAVAAATK